MEQLGGSQQLFNQMWHWISILHALLQRLCHGLPRKQHEAGTLLGWRF